MCPPQSIFPKENKPQKLIQVPLGLEAPLKSLKYKFRFSFCLMDRKKKIMVQAGFWLSSTPSRTPSATQEQDKSMKGVFCPMGK